MPKARYASRATFAGVLLLGCAIALAADKATELSDEFLEYLASMESDDENWTQFTTAAEAKPVVAAKVVAAASSSSSSRSAASSAAKADK